MCAPHPLIQPTPGKRKNFLIVLEFILWHMPSRSTKEPEEGGSGVQGQPGLELVSILNMNRLSLVFPEQWHYGHSTYIVLSMMIQRQFETWRGDTQVIGKYYHFL
jgi:hypothetical protein